jgi:hypothetical protein
LNRGWQAYDAHASCAVEANSTTLALFGALALLLSWCALAAYTELQAIATLLSYLAAWLCYVVCLHAAHRRHLDLPTLCDDLTPEMVVQGVLTALQQQRDALREREHDSRAGGLTKSSSLRDPNSLPITLKQREAYLVVVEAYWRMCGTVSDCPHATPAHA